MKTTSYSLRALGGKILASTLLALLTFNAHADSVKADNADDLDLTTSWTNGIVPTGAVAIWDANVTTANTVTIGSGVSFSGIRFDQPGPVGNVTINAGSGTLALGTSGVDLSTVSNTLSVASTVTLNGNQVWKTGTNGAAGATSISVNGIISGSGGLSLDSANTRSVDLNAANIFTGGFTLNPGSIVRYGVAAVVSGGNTTSSPLGTYDGSQALVINGGRINNPNVTFHAKNITLNGDFTFNNSFRIDFNGAFDMVGGTRTITLTRNVTPVNAVIVGGNTALRIGTGSSFSNGIIRFAADASVAATNYCVLNFGSSANANFIGNSPLVLGEKVMFTANSATFTTAAQLPSVTLEAGSWWNLSEAANIRNPQVNSLAGAGTVATLYNGGSVGTKGTLTIRGNSGTTTEFTGRIIDTDTAVFSTAINGVTLVSKQGSTTQILSGTNTYSGLTTISGGSLVTTTISSNGIYTISGGATLGVKVAAAGTSLYMTGLTNANTSKLNIDLSNMGNPTATVITNAGDNVVNGAVTVNLLGTKSAMSLGTFTILSSASRSGAGNYVLGTTPLGVNASLTDQGTNVLITINSFTPIWTWSGLSGNDWNINVPANLNWLDDSLAGIFYNEPAQFVVFDDSATGSTNVNLTATVSPPSVLLRNSTLDYSLAGSGKISGATTFTKEGSRTITISTANDYNGATTITAGTVKLGASGVLPDGGTAADITLNGKLDLAGFNETVNGLTGGGTVDTSAGSATITVGNNDASSSFGGPIINSGGTLAVTKTGAGFVTLSGVSTYGGGTLISAGTLEALNNLGSAPVTNNATLALSSGTFANVITGPGQVIKNGTGTLTPTGNNTYTGNTIITDGRVTVNNANAFGAAAGYTSVGVVSNRSTVSIEGGVTVNEPLQLANIGDAGSPSGALISNSGSNTWAGNITIAGNDARVGASAGATLHISGPIDSGGNLYTNANIAFHTRRGTVILSGGSTYLGNTAFGQGTNVIAGGNNRLPVSTVLFIGYGGSSWFDLNGQSQEVAGLDVWFDSYNPVNTYLVYNYDANPSTLTVNAGSTNTEYRGNLDGNLTLVKTGTNIFTLSGINSHSNTVVSGGTLLENGFESSAPVTVNTGGTLGGFGSITPTVNINSGGALAPGVSGTGTLTISGALTLASGSQTKVDINSDDSTSDAVFGPSSVSYNGTLVVNNLGSATVVNGQTFTLFSASNPSGNFSSISPASPAAGLVWSFNPTNGVLSAITGSAAPSPTNITYMVTGNQLVLSWPNGQGWKLQSQTNALASGLTTNWTDVSPAPTSPCTNTVNPANPTVFYRLVYP